MLKVRRIIDNLINALDFRYKSEIAASDILCNIVSELSESETESKQKIRVSLLIYLLSDGYPIQKLEIPNLKYPIKPKRGG